MTKLDVHFLEEIIGEYHDNYYPSNIDDEVTEVMNQERAEAAFYWYGSGIYEGDGEIIYLKEGKWYVYSMSHCSCYGPLEHIGRSTTAYDSFESLQAACTNEYSKKINPLIDLIKSKGYGPAKPDIIIGIGVLL